MQRFYIHSGLTPDMQIDDPNFVHQVTRVLRMERGGQVILFDGDGSEMLYEIGDISKKTIFLRGLKRSFPKERETKREITLYQALPNKYEKIEWILQKSVEIWLKKVCFFRSDRSQKLLINDKKQERFAMIAIEALEQSGGLVPMEIEFLDTVPILDEISLGGNISLDTTGSQKALSELSTESPQNLNLWVGPEWGWSEEERHFFSNNWFIIAHFWERVLRTETAWIVVGFWLIHG